MGGRRRDLPKAAEKTIHPQLRGGKTGRNAMPIPTEPVGSLPRPMKLQQAFADYDAGKIKHEELEREQDAACLDSIKRSEATGEPIVSDGEQRMSSVATYPLTDALAGTGLAYTLP